MKGHKKLKYWLYHLAQLFHFEDAVAEAQTKFTLELIWRPLLQRRCNRPPQAFPQVLPIPLLQCWGTVNASRDFTRILAWLTESDRKSWGSL